MTDPLAQLLAGADKAGFPVPPTDPTFHDSFDKSRADWLRARRADVLRALYPDISDALTDLGLTELSGSATWLTFDIQAGRLVIAFDRHYPDPINKDQM